MILRKEFYYLRHGQTEANAQNIMCGPDNDPPLNPTGIKQAHAIQEHICQLPIQTICHSPMVRAKQTLHIATQGLTATTVEITDLIECQGPIWLHMTTNNTTQDVLTFYKQTISGINQALAHPDPVLIIAHGGIHWALCSQLNIQNYIWDIDNCQLVHFTPHNESEWMAKILEISTS